jgi:hypothetical protein
VVNAIELSALWELAAVPREQERVRLLFLERALARPEVAPQLARRADMASVAALGLDPGRREPVLLGLRTRLHDTGTDGRVRAASALVMAALAAPTSEDADEAARAILEALERTRDP